MTSRLEDRGGPGAEGAADPTGILPMAASATLAARLEGRVSGPKVIGSVARHDAWGAACRRGNSCILTMTVDMREDLLWMSMRA